MHDIKAIRQNPEAFDAALARRGLPPHASLVLELDAQKRAGQTQLQELLAKRNALAKQIGMAKGKGEDAAPIMEESKKNNEAIAALEASLNERGALEALLETLPNLPAADVPEGKDEHGNVEVRQHGQKPTLAFTPKEHFELGEALKMMDFEGAAKLSGARFVVLKGALARMERALASFMLDTHTLEFGYTEHVPPFMVRDAAMYGTGQLPKFANDLFKLTQKIFSTKEQPISYVSNKQVDFKFENQETQRLFDEAKRSPGTSYGFDTESTYVSTNMWLIPTAEVPLTNLVADSIIDEATLPLRLTAYTPCFRSEAGSAGKDTRGMIRQHQFSKVELVSITRPEESEAEHERMTAAAETILKKLGLHYRVMLLCTGDMGFCSQKTYDIEVWLPGQNAYREISSCSNCGPFQARRMKGRFKPQGSKETQFVHTLNGSGLAIGRTMVAILENYQNADGSITVPEALRPYMGGLEVIRAL